MTATPLLPAVVLSCLQPLQDRLQHAVDVVHHLRVEKAQHGVAALSGGIAKDSRKEKHPRLSL